MPKNVVLYRLFVASPHDVQPERQIVSEVVSEWNLQQGLSEGVMIDVALWETHAFPAAGDRGQALINRQVLDSADLIVGVFWSHFGTPTGGSESGTEEEIRRGIEQGKRIMLYFSDRALPPSQLVAEQYDKVKRFKEDFKDQGLYWTYSALEAFRNDFRRHLTAVLDEMISDDQRPAQAANETDNSEEMIAIALPAKYWTLIVFGMNDLVQTSTKRIEELREKKIAPESIPDDMTTALIGPVIARGMIIKELAARGVMKKEANDLMGVDRINTLSKEYLQRKK